MLDSLITSKARLKLILRFFMNPESKGYLRELATEFDESTNNIRVELNRLTKAKLLLSENSGRTVLYKANVEHSLFSDLQSVVKKYVGFDHLVEDLIKQLGQLHQAYVVGDYARGIDSGLIDLVLVGKVNSDVLQKLVEKTSLAIKRKIRPLVLSCEELDQLKNQLKLDKALLLWENSGSKS